MKGIPHFATAMASFPAPKLPIDLTQKRTKQDYINRKKEEQKNDFPWIELDSCSSEVSISQMWN